MKKTFHNAIQRHGAHAPRGFTLVELLVTITIIAILATVFLGAMAAAQRSASIANTQALVAKLHGQIEQRYETYRTRRMPVNTAGMSSQVAAATRLAAIRETMRMELPDRWSDVTTPQSLLPSPPAVSRSYLNRYNSINPRPSTQYEDAECLYLIITTGLADDSLGAERMNTADIGDADGDGAPEFHDAWGNPIRFLRWAPGFVSDLQLHDPVAHHDPFDPRKIHPQAYALFPLIYSAGLDRAYDVLRPTTSPTVTRNTVSMLDPMYGGTSVGGPADDDGDGDAQGFQDNIHNHFIGGN